MHFHEHHEGELRIYAGAIESHRHDGFLAAVIVHRVQADGATVEVFRDDRLCGGYAWPTPDAAMSFAVQRARSVMRREALPQIHDLPEVAKAAAVTGGSVGRRNRAASMLA